MRNFLLLLFLAVAAVATAQPPGGDFVERYKAAMSAYEAKDYARMESELRAALKLRPAHPRATYNLAVAQALRGDGKMAVETLETLADQGLVFHPEDDADFASLKDARGFTSLRRSFARNADRRGDAQRMFRLKSPGFIPEGIAYDPERGNFYVGSVHERRIQGVRGDDVEFDFVKPGAGPLWAPFGMNVDGKRDLLWVATTAVPEMKDANPAELGQSAILGYELETGKLKHRFVLDGNGHALGDVIVARDGTLYTTDSRGGALYSVDPKTGRFEALTRPGELSSPQGLAFSDDRRGLHVADYTQGLYYFDLKKRELTRLKVDEDVSVYGIDGLYAYEGDLIAIYNGVRPHRVAQLRLGQRGLRVERARVLAANLEDFDEPTLGVRVRNNFYFIANSQWGKFDKQHRLPPPEQLRRPMVMRIKLESSMDDSGFGPEPPATPAPAPAPGALPCVQGVTC